MGKHNVRNASTRRAVALAAATVTLGAVSMLSAGSASADLQCTPENRDRALVNLKVRAAPDTNAPVIGQIPEGGHIEQTGPVVTGGTYEGPNWPSAYWKPVNFNGHPGFVASLLTC